MINITKHIEALNKHACNPHGYWSVGLPLFNLNTQKTAGNDNEWSMAA